MRAEINSSVLTRPVVRVSLYNSSSFPAWRSYVEKSCPDVSIQWEDNRNSCMNVVYMAKHGNIPDIIAIRRFESDSARLLEPYLSDLNTLDITQSFIPEYLEPFENNGKQYWLPEPFLIEGMYANTDLFRQCGVALPTDLSSFIDACHTFEKYNYTVCGFDCEQGWTNAAVIEGFGAAGILSMQKEKQNLKSFLDGTMQQVNAQSSAALANTLRLLKKNGILTEEDLTTDPYMIAQKLLNGTMAIYRTNSDERYNPAERCRYVALPFFGKTPADSILYTYPVFSLALSKRSERNTTHRKACIGVLNCMFDEAALKILGQDSDGLISPLKNTTLELSPAMDVVKPLIKQRKCFIRELNANTFRACTAAINAIVKDDADDATFTAVVNKTLFEKRDVHVVGTSKINAVNIRNRDCNSPAASIIAEMMRAETGSQCAVIDSREAAAPFYKGQYTTDDLAAVVLDGPVYTGKLSAAELSELIDTAILYTTTFIPGSTEPLLDYPALAGLQIEIERDGTVISKIKNGSYSVAVSARVYNALVSGANSLANCFCSDQKTLAVCIENQMSAKKQPEPHPYFIVRR